jgi:hypothetical protein
LTRSILHGLNKQAEEWKLGRFAKTPFYACHFKQSGLIFLLQIGGSI